MKHETWNYQTAGMQHSNYNKSIILLRSNCSVWYDFDYYVDSTAR